ncbi:MAG: hypothetical protein BGO98_16130 [Myxococcales bacterium 68-20]|nr:hypothetical protein [Myxococcales bacterium]OJY31557.1 MAG: hypothetical protein BGO98_16130 [Myxococcales bacterium 68-20]
MRQLLFRIARIALCIGPAALFAAPVHADVVADRVAIRVVTPETGGVARPRFFTERELAFFARIEALLEQTPLEPNDYPERYVRSAIDRLVARSMLASLMIQRGVEPPELPHLALEARAELEARLGGPHVLADAMKKEGIEDEELLSFLRDEVRARYYVDRAIAPILTVTEDSLREAFRSTLHPFRGGKFDDVRVKLRRWLVTERLRAAELEFLQGARARIKITTVRATSSSEDSTRAHR